MLSAILVLINPFKNSYSHCYSFSICISNSVKQITHFKEYNIIACDLIWCNRYYVENKSISQYGLHDFIQIVVLILHWCHMHKKPVKCESNSSTETPIQYQHNKLLRSIMYNELIIIIRFIR